MEKTVKVSAAFSAPTVGLYDKDEGTAGGLCPRVRSWLSRGVILRPCVVGKAYVPKKMVDPIMESVTLEPELEEALASATDAELCDIAGKTAPYLCNDPHLRSRFS